MSHQIEIGEYVVSAYLKHVEKCNVVDYKVRRPVQGIEAMNEIDVIGFHFEKRKVFYVKQKLT